MGKRKRKSGNEDKALKTIILVTAILNLITAALILIERLL